MSDSRKRKPSNAIHSPVAKQPRNQTPIVISDDSDDDIRQISPPRLTAKQKGKGRAPPETDGLSHQLRDVDVISISDDEAPIPSAISRQQTPLEVPDHQPDSLKETSAELELSSEVYPPDQILEQFRDIFFGERKCSQCERAIRPVRSPVCRSPFIPFIKLTWSCRWHLQIARTLQSRSTCSASSAESVTAVDACRPFSAPRRVGKSMNVIRSSVALVFESSPFLRSLGFWIPAI